MIRRNPLPSRITNQNNNNEDLRWQARWLAAVKSKQVPV
jgi:hypothetical protein